MESFSFVLKTFLFTVALVWLTQFRVDNRSVEKHFLGYVRESGTIEPLHRVADGSRKLGNDALAFLKEFINGVDTKTETKTQTETTRKASSFKWSWDSGKSEKTSETGDESDLASEDLE